MERRAQFSGSRECEMMDLIHHQRNDHETGGGGGGPSGVVGEVRCLRLASRSEDLPASVWCVGKCLG